MMIIHWKVYFINIYELFAKSNYNTLMVRIRSKLQKYRSFTEIYIFYNFIL